MKKRCIDEIRGPGSRDARLKLGGPERHAFFMGQEVEPRARPLRHPEVDRCIDGIEPKIESGGPGHKVDRDVSVLGEKAGKPGHQPAGAEKGKHRRSEEHTSELQSLMRISYAVFCLKKKKNQHYISS